MGTGRFVTKEVIALVTVTTLAFLVLTHSRGFARAISATGQSFATSVKVLQGRG